MRTHQYAIYFAVAAALATSSCDIESRNVPKVDKSSNADLKAIDIRTFGGGIYYITDPCPDNTKVVQKFTISMSSFDTNSVKRNIKNDGDGTDAKFPSTKPPGGMTPLDISVILANDYDAAEITIDLTGSNLEFMRDKGKNKMAITAADGGGLQMFCDVEFDPGQPKIARFKAHRLGGVGGSGDFAGYNIGLFYRVTDETLGELIVPFHIDPNIKNDG